MHKAQKTLGMNPNHAFMILDPPQNTKNKQKNTWATEKTSTPGQLDLYPLFFATEKNGCEKNEATKTTKRSVSLQSCICSQPHGLSHTIQPPAKWREKGMQTPLKLTIKWSP